MTFRLRLLIGCVVAALVPLLLLAFGVRRQLSERLELQYRERVNAFATVVRQDIEREGERLARGLATIVRTMAEDDALRGAVLQGRPESRRYLLDYAERAMRVTGLSVLQIQDEAGRILSSGHFRNEFDRLEPEVPRLLATLGSRGALMRARTPTGPMIALMRVDSVRIGVRRLHVVGGIAVDDAFLARFARTDGLTVALEMPDTALTNQAGADGLSGVIVDTLALPFADVRAGGRIVDARLTIAHSLAALDALRRDVNRWFLVALGAIVVGAVVLATWLSTRLSQPLAELARAAERIELSGASVAVAADRNDEFGVLARRLSAMTARLRASAGQLRNAERRATVGDMARQVNHDVKNGLIPIRNVLRHLGDVQAQRPAELPAAFAERRATLDSSVEYLETLARNYARLTPRLQSARIDVNAVIREVATAAGGPVATRLASSLPPVDGDPVALRRIVDNLVRNALESLGADGRVMIATSRSEGGDVLISVADNGRGMTEDELAHAFDDFFTTKSEGTGLGLSVVRRLTTDLRGSVRAESVPGKGTTIRVELPCPRS